MGFATEEKSVASKLAPSNAPVLLVSWQNEINGSIDGKVYQREDKPELRACISEFGTIARTQNQTIPVIEIALPIDIYSSII
jgi:hypothetical protein